MPSLLANVPEGIVWGRVTAYVTSFVADGGTALPDGTPDAIPLNGTVMLTPTVGVMAFPTLTPPQQAAIQSLACPVIGGVLYAPGTTTENVGDRDPGVILVASEQPLGLPDRVQYKVTWALEGAQVTPVTIDVPSQGTVDLATVIPATPGPGTVVVVSTVDRERAEAAAALAELAAVRAENASLADVDYDLILGRVEPLVGDAVSAGLAGVDDLVASALVPYATTAALTSGLAGKQDSGDYALVSQLPDVSGLATKNALTSGLAEKQNVGDYATKADLPDVSELATTAALMSGLAGKQPVGDYVTTSDLPDLGAYATTAYVDQAVGDIDTALAGILGGN